MRGQKLLKPLWYRRRLLAVDACVLRNLEEARNRSGIASSRCLRINRELPSVILIPDSLHMFHPAALKKARRSSRQVDPANPCNAQSAMAITFKVWEMFRESQASTR